jgi:hypothetical protein
MNLNHNPLQSGARDGYAKLKPTILASKKKAGDNIKMACEENLDFSSSDLSSQNGIKKPERVKKNKKNGKKEPSTSAASAEANLVERIALDLDNLDLAEVSAEMVNNSGSEEESGGSKRDSVVQALASGVEVTPSEGGKVR